MPKGNIHDKANRLINEKSPYLLQHAYNPVKWLPWGDEAFSKAKAEDKPIFLSIGYSTCHWCHVMERESFEDEEVADILNKDFIAIKVDREERPDIDHVYMLFCQALTGHGGWPLTIFMTSDKKPFYAGTYFPKTSRYGQPGLMDILPRISQMWRQKKEELEESSEEIFDTIRDSAILQDKSEIPKEIVHKVFNELEDLFDSEYGGFAAAPKFPMPHYLYFLLRYYKFAKDEKALKIVEKTLDSMYKGGIFDHVGYGFARYSTDKKWLVPHFEKMLYDNALLAIAYLEAYQTTGKGRYAQIADKVLTYILRDMTSLEGGFYSAEDADSEGVEGKFYVWDVEEVKEVLGKEDGELFCKYYDITQRGNFEGKNIPNLIQSSLTDIEQDKELEKKLNACRKKLFECREERIHPHKDDKILTAWNGLTIAAMAYAGRIMGNPDYIDAAKKAATFVLNHLKREDGRLLARYRKGEAAYLGTLDDYAFLIWGLIELYETTFDSIYFENVLDLQQDMIYYFWDEKDGGFWISGKDTKDLIMKPKDAYDGAIPSGNSVAAMNMLRLSKMTGNEELQEKAEILFFVFGDSVGKNPSAHIYLVTAFLFANISVKEIVISGSKEAEDTQAMIAEINKRFLPFATIILNDGDEKLHSLVPFVKEQKQLKECKATAYICENFQCNAPTEELNQFLSLLDK
jgi:uncharacterized protein YyaL (SSP411 family)